MTIFHSDYDGNSLLKAVLDITRKLGVDTPPSATKKCPRAQSRTATNSTQEANQEQVQ